jgi:hypothetical protein
MENIVSYEDFIFKKSLLKDGVFNIKYSINLKTIEGVRHPKIDDDIKDPHPDLKKSLANFRDMLIEMWNLDKKEDINVIGIQVKKKGDDVGIKILGERKIENDYVDMNSSMIYTTENLTYGKKIKFMYEHHKKEVYAALYEDKTSQQRLDLKDNEGK